MYDTPSFLAIGPPKTGTTWLYANLKNHPEVYLPPDKELRYFWELNYAPNNDLWTRMTCGHWHYRKKRIKLRMRLVHHFSTLFRGKFDYAMLRWDFNYFLARRNDAWYAQLFDPQKVSGDITPKYCELPEAELARISQTWPQTKIIITLRDPIERDWSRAKMNLCRKTGLMAEEVPQADFFAHFDEQPQSDTNDYVKLIELWQRHFGSDRCQFFFFDELQENPKAFYQKVCTFLAIPPDPKQYTKLRKRVLEGVKDNMDSKYREYLFNKHKENLEKMIDYFGPDTYPTKWLATQTAKLQKA